MQSEKIIELIFGKRGCGKSYLAKKLVADLRRSIVFDTLGEYTEGVVVETIENLATIWKNVYDKGFRFIYQPLDPECEFEKICELIYDCGNLTFLVEEVDCFCNPLSMGLNFKSIIQRGRHKNISLIGITQRPHGISRLLTSQAKKMSVFNTTEPRDLQYFTEIFGEDFVKKISELKQYEYVCWQDGIEELVVSRA